MILDPHGAHAYATAHVNIWWPPRPRQLKKDLILYSATSTNRNTDLAKYRKVLTDFFLLDKFFKLRYTLSYS